MKFFLAFLFLLQMCISTQQIPKYYTDIHMQKSVIWNRVARQRFLRCKDYVLKQAVTKGYNEDEIAEQLKKCKISFNRTMTLGKKRII